MDKNGFGLSRDVIALVQMYIIRENNIQSRFKDQHPGTDRLAFTNRHCLSLKKPECIKHVIVNPWIVYNFIEILDATLKEVKELNLKGKPRPIFSCDKMSFCHNPSKTKIVGSSSTKSKFITNLSGRENTSVLLCCSAVGRMLLLLCVYQGKYLIENWINEEVASQTAILTTSWGWMKTALFYDWFQD
ncbi:hypothetical protein PR048_025051, partial [Dryococelus australis]